MARPQIVIDTSGLISALRSQEGAAYQLLMRAGTGLFEINLSVPLVLEYEEIAKRQSRELGLSLQAIDDILNYLCAVARRRKIYYLWRPGLPDQHDDMVLEVAVAGGCDYLVTYNLKDFAGAERFGLQVTTPQTFLAQIGEW